MKDKKDRVRRKWATKRMGEEDEEHRKRIYEGQEGWR